MLSSCILFERRKCTNMWKLNQFYFNEKPGNMKDPTELNSFFSASTTYNYVVNRKRKSNLTHSVK